MHESCITPRTVALTYDDNPFESVYDLLALLKSYNATATFFPNAPYHFNVWKLDKYIAAAYAAGHQIGLHTWDHVHMNDVEPQKVLDNLEKMNSWIYKVIGVRSTFVRPPWALNTEDWRYQKEDNVQSSIDIINSWESSQVYIDDDSHFSSFTGILLLEEL
ncbi:hypothetical protein FPRO04_14237 [Fusarium proliferatum]|nr:hypothetical protein FPRO04_14237 [Fusarium proliferatum]